MQEVQEAATIGAGSYLRQLWLTCAAACLLPLPALLTLDAATNSEISFLYLGLSSGYLAHEIIRYNGTPRTKRDLNARIVALSIAILLNLAIFIGFGIAAGVQSNIPFALLAAFSVLPAIGLVPWLTLRIREPLAPILLAGLIVFAAKLAGCVVARIRYGPDFISMGYVSGDWHSAKLMITVFWSLTILISAASLIGAFAYRPKTSPAR